MNFFLYAQEKADSVPVDILKNLSKIGIDDNPLLNQYESQFLNYYFSKAGYVGTVKNIDFTNLRVAFFKGNIGTIEYSKKDFFAEDINLFSPSDNLFQIIIFSKYNVAKTNYDATIIYCSKRYNTEKQMVRILNKNHHN